MANQQLSNPPTAAYCLSLIGGILGVLSGVAITFFLLFTIVLWPIGVWVIVANALIINYAKRLMDQPREHSKYGTYILILSIIGGGNLLALIGGILAMTYQPMSTQPYAPAALPAISTIHTATTPRRLSLLNMLAQSTAHNAAMQSAQKQPTVLNAAPNCPLRLRLPFWAMIH